MLWAQILQVFTTGQAHSLYVGNYYYFLFPQRLFYVTASSFVIFFSMADTAENLKKQCKLNNIGAFRVIQTSVKS